MKIARMFLTIVMIILIAAPSFAVAEDCEHPYGVPHHEDYDYQQRDLFKSHFKIQVKVYYCYACESYFRVRYGDPIPEACTYVENFTAESFHHNSTQHWEIGRVDGECTKCKDVWVNNDKERNRENHTEGAAIDIGHMGNLHWFEYRCTKSSCNSYLTRTVSVPCTGDNHVIILGIPIHHETE